MIFEKFQVFPKDKYVIILTMFGLTIVLLIYILIFIPIEALVSTYGILDYEFAWTPERVQTIFSAWGTEGMNNQALAIYWDFLYIIGYVSLAVGLILIILRRSDNKMRTVGLYFTLVPFLTGIFDLIENINLLLMLNNPTSITIINSLTASVCALIKFSLLFAAITYFVVALIIIIVHKFSK
ncbi:MAG: hypothetical protein ACFFDF_22765 [Candidatus Odinarchaeota archaeon]